MISQKKNQWLPSKMRRFFFHLQQFRLGICHYFTTEWFCTPCFLSQFFLFISFSLKNTQKLSLFYFGSWLRFQEISQSEFIKLIYLLYNYAKVILRKFVLTKVCWMIDSLNQMLSSLIFQHLRKQSHLRSLTFFNTILKTN